MSDITLCTNQTCPSREECYRFKSAPNPFVQAYGKMQPKEGEDRCAFFMEIKS